MGDRGQGTAPQAQWVVGSGQWTEKKFRFGVVIANSEFGFE
jgi:hypothetical protein